jgi:predicted RNase H-like HicB family nuclease
MFVGATTFFASPQLAKKSIFNQRVITQNPIKYDKSGKYSSNMEPATLKYEVIIYWSDEDNAFVAEVPELPGCMAHGDTYESALQNVRDAMSLWLDVANEFGDPIPVPKGQRLMIA